jgi:type IV pilus assembly protein PilM
MIFLKNIAVLLRRFLFSAGASMVAVEVHAAELMVIELAKKNDQYSVENLLSYQINSGASSAAETIRSDDKSVALKKIVEELGLTGRPVCSSVSNALVMSKMIELSASLSLVEIEHRVMLEIDRFIPYPIEEISFDYEIQDDSGGDKGQINVLLVASRRENVDDQIAVLSAAGLKPVILDVDVYAMERAFSLLVGQLPEGVIEKPVAIYDFRGNSVTLYVMYGERNIYMREQNLGVQQVKKESHDFYGAETLPEGKGSEEGLIQAENPVTIINNAVVIQQVLRGLQFYDAANINDPVGHIVLAGDVAVNNDIDEAIKQQVGVAISIADPFKEMVFSKHLDKLDLTPSVFMIACGLALRGFVNGTH